MFKLNPAMMLANALSFSPRLPAIGLPDTTVYKRTASDGNHHYMAMNRTSKRGKFKPRTRQHG